MHCLMHDRNINKLEKKLFSSTVSHRTSPYIAFPHILLAQSMLQIWVVHADAGVWGLIGLIGFKSWCSPRRKRVEWNLNTYLSLRPFFPQLRMTEKLVHLELSCQDPAFRQAREFSKESVKGIIHYKTLFFMIWSIKWWRICSYPTKSREVLISKYRKGHFFFFFLNCTMTFCILQTFSNKDPALIFGNKYNHMTSTSIVAASSES